MGRTWLIPSEDPSSAVTPMDMTAIARDIAMAALLTSHESSKDDMNMMKDG